MEFILRFTFTNPDLDTTIVGTISPAHFADQSRHLAERATIAGALRGSQASSRRCRFRTTAQQGIVRIQPLGHRDPCWFATITVSVADAPRPNESW